MIRKSVIGASIALLVTSAAIFAGPAIAAPAPKDVLTHYSALAEAKFQDALSTAKALDATIDALIAKPSDETLKAARAAWIAARVPYQQTEVYRFGNPIVDDWEGKVNA